MVPAVADAYIALGFDGRKGSSDLMTQETAAAAFAEWHRRWTEEPTRFKTEAAALAQPDDEYGAGAARYFLAIATEQEAAS